MTSNLIIIQLYVSFVLNIIYSYYFSNSNTILTKFIYLGKGYTRIHIKNYLPRMTLIVTLFEDAASWFSFHISVSRLCLIDVKVGCLGIDKLEFSLSIINITAGMFGLWAATSCTHSMPTCMHLTTCSREQDFVIKGSSNSIALPLSQRSHACLKTFKRKRNGLYIDLEWGSFEIEKLLLDKKAYISNDIRVICRAKAGISPAAYDLQ